MTKRLFSTFLFVFLSLSFFTAKNVFADSCTCDGNLNVTANSCGNNIPTCGGHGINVTCTCLNSTGTLAADSTAISCTDGNGNIGVNTALGCVPVEMDKFVAWLLPYLFGIGGGIAFILMIIGFIQMTTSQGDPKAVQGAKETITSAVIGLLVCLFAIFLLRLITVNILKIPGIS